VSIVVVGQLLDQLGMAQRLEREVVGNWQIGFDVRTRTHAWATPADNVRRYQANKIPLLIGHDPGAVIGAIRHLQLAGRHLWGVGEIDEDVDPERLPALWFSAATDSQRDGSDVVITHVGVVEATAQCGLAPVTFLRGRLRYPEERQRWRLGECERKIVERAADMVRCRHGSEGPMVVYEEQAEKLQADDPSTWEFLERRDKDLALHRGRPPGPLRHGPVVPGSVLRVS